MARKTALAVSILCLGLLAFPSAVAAAEAGCSWRIVPPDPRNGGFLFRVNALSDSDAWAVGNDGNATLAEHWNGATWKTVPTPPPAPGYRETLEDVADLAPDDAWAVGVSFAPDDGTGSTLVEHWDGSTWSIVASPNPGSYINQLTSMDAMSGSDIWAVGFSENGLVGSPLIEHWDGTSWSVVPGPPVTGGLGGVAAISADDIWAAGYQTYVTHERAVMLHWDGASWTVSATFNGKTAAHDVAAAATDDLVSVGIAPLPGLLWSAHWNGSAWKPFVPEGSPSEQLYGVAMTADGQAWAVGYTDGVSLNGVIEQWNGLGWHSVSIPVSGNSQLLGVAAVPGSNAVWAVGFASRPLILRRC